MSRADPRKTTAGRHFVAYADAETEISAKRARPGSVSARSPPGGLSPRHQSFYLPRRFSPSALQFTCRKEAL